MGVTLEGLQETLPRSRKGGKDRSPAEGPRLAAVSRQAASVAAHQGARAGRNCQRPRLAMRHVRVT